MKAAILKHRIFTVGYVMRESDREGRLDMDRVTQLGVPKGPLLSQLKAGKAVTFPVPVVSVSTEEEQKHDENADDDKDKKNTTLMRSKTVQPEDVMTPPVSGGSLVILGDTCGSARIRRVLSPPPPPPSSSRTRTPPTLSTSTTTPKPRSTTPRSVPLTLVHEATFDDTMSELAVPRGHSTARMAGEFGASLGATRVLLTHLSARYGSIEDLQRLTNEAISGYTDATIGTRAAETTTETETETTSPAKCSGSGVGEARAPNVVVVNDFDTFHF